ncbi:hypothetical protein RugamoR57_37230 [Duganella caerulea]
MLKKFEYNNTNTQRDELLVYAFHPDVLTAPTKELRELKASILRYYPRTEHEGIVRPFTANTDYYLQWREAHDHVDEILAKRWSKLKFGWTTGLAAATLAVLIWTLIDTMVHRAPPAAAAPAAPTAPSAPANAHPAASVPASASKSAK